MAVPIVPIAVDDVVSLKKPHACGGADWRVTKTGMDIGLECARCGRRIRLPRYDFDRRFRGYVSRAAEDLGERDG